jgi:hypothetical protein
MVLTRWSSAALFSAAVIGTAQSASHNVAAAPPPVTLAACSAAVAAMPAAQTVVPRKIADVKHYPKHNMTFEANGTTDGAIQVDASAGEFGFRKKVFPDGTFTVDLEATNDRVSIRYADTGVEISRGDETLVLTTTPSEEKAAAVVRLLADSRAARLLRTKSAAFEADEDDSSAAASLLLVDGLVGSLTGDVGAPMRVARLLTKKARAQLHSASRPNTCYYSWEDTILWAYLDYEECVYFYFYPLTMCSLRWTLQAESAWFRFIACSGFGF